MSGQDKQQLWQERLDAWRASGESMRSFAARQGWAPRQLAWWKKRLAEAAAEPIPLLPVKVKAIVASGPIRLAGPNWSLDLPSTTPAAWLAELLRSL
jgi:hypothetical protein